MCNSVFEEDEMTKDLVKRLREKESRDNRALLDEAADAIERHVHDDEPCAYCRSGGVLVEDMIDEIVSFRVELLLSPTPHLLARFGGKAVGVAINACPVCGRWLQDK
jgi:hypothetical protein